ncbi:MAG: phosphoribosyl-AMP cyclohydrolase [Pontimonas sp.]|jgi:phosphoribosyl-AMP cyclohydrolase
MTKTPWVVQAESDLMAHVHFDERGLIPCIAQDDTSREVLMMAWMNQEALLRTLQEGRVTYYSRSRRELWRKGDTSGNTQHALRVRADCDGDTLILDVHQVGPACHTGSQSCFDANHPS